MIINYLKENLNSTIRLYRGLEEPLDINHDTAKTDAMLGYSTWTDNVELAREYAGADGYVYSIDLPKSGMGDNAIDEDPKSDTYGDRVLFFFNNKPSSINGVNGNEVLVYTHHDEYNPKSIKRVNI